MSIKILQVSALAAALLAAAFSAQAAQPTIIIGAGTVATHNDLISAPAVSQEASQRVQISWNGPRVETAPTAASAVASQPAAQPTIVINRGGTASAAQAQVGVVQAMYSPTAAASSTLFGRSAVMSSDTSAFSKWTQVVELQKKAIEQPHSATTQAWLDFLGTLRGLSPQAQIAAVNDYANKVQYVEDIDNYGVQDYWATPEEFFARGGDCEDYAIAKYASLQMLGFDVSHMRVVVLFDQYKQERHAVLAVQDGAEIKILDNLSARVMTASEIDHYVPIYAISQNGWWRFV